jgi:hypothetical protein
MSTRSKNSKAGSPSHSNMEEASTADSVNKQIPEMVLDPEKGKKIVEKFEELKIETEVKDDEDEVNDRQMALALSKMNASEFDLYHKDCENPPKRVI